MIGCLVALAIAGCGSVTGGSSGSARETVLRTLDTDIAGGAASPDGPLAQCVTDALRSEPTLTLHELAYAGFPPEPAARREISGLFTTCITAGQGTRRIRRELAKDFAAAATGVTATPSFAACVRARAAAVPARTVAQAYASVIVSGGRSTERSEAVVRGLGNACFGAPSTRAAVRAAFVAGGRRQLAGYPPAARRCLRAQVAKTPTATIVAIDRAGVTDPARAKALGAAAAQAWAAACGNPAHG